MEILHLAQWKCPDLIWYFPDVTWSFPVIFWMWVSIRFQWKSPDIFCSVPEYRERPIISAVFY